MIYASIHEIYLQSRNTIEAINHQPSKPSENLKRQKLKRKKFTKMVNATVFSDSITRKFYTDKYTDNHNNNSSNNFHNNQLHNKAVS